MHVSCMYHVCISSVLCLQFAIAVLATNCIFNAVEFNSGIIKDDNVLSILSALHSYQVSANDNYWILSLISDYLAPSSISLSHTHRKNQLKHS